jgi:hypothetical protein
MNQHPAIDFSEHVGDVPPCAFVIAPRENSTDNAAHFHGIVPRLPGVNRDKKGLRPHRQKASAHLAPPKAGTHSNALQ